MAKLFFRYGTMNSGKSLDILKVYHNYEENNRNCLIIKPSIDDRTENYVYSRTGLKKEALLFNEFENLYCLIENKNNKLKIDAILVDESQFLKKDQVFQLSKVVDILNIPVICYGLRSDFKMEPFEGSKYLMTISDTLEEIKTICSICGNKKANINLRIDENKKPVLEGNQIELGFNDKYLPVCRKCYYKVLNF